MPACHPGDLAIERRLNAMVMVMHVGKLSNVGGHIATYQSAAALYDVGFDHFYIQGHSAPGIYGMGKPAKARTSNHPLKKIARLHAGIDERPRPALTDRSITSILSR